jgi:hypothetical protein
LLRTQLSNVRPFARDHDWEVSADLEALTVEVSMSSPIDDEEYIIHLECAEYDARPPFVEMADPETGEHGTPNAYFDDRSGPGKFLIAYPDKDRPIICHRFNRRVYEEDGVHDNWNNIAGWQQEAGNLTTIGDILAYIYSRLHEPHYDGRYEVK